MPVIPSSIYPNLSELMDLVRALVNDTFTSADGTPGAGRNFTNGAPFTITFINQAQRELERKLANNGVTTYQRIDYPIPGVAQMANPDPGLFCSISYTGYFDGTGTNANIFLPDDLYIPLQLAQRPAGSTQQFAPISQVNALISQIQSPFIPMWAWAIDAIQFVGATSPLDLLLNYEARIFVPVTETDDFDTTTLGTADSFEAVAYTMAYNYVSARGGAGAQGLEAKKIEAVDGLISRYVRSQQGIGNHRIPYGSQDAGLPGWE